MYKPRPRSDPKMHVSLSDIFAQRLSFPGMRVASTQTTVARVTTHSHAEADTEHHTRGEAIDNRDYVTGIGNDDVIVYIIMRTRVYIPSCKICTC